VKLSLRLTLLCGIALLLVAASGPAELPNGKTRAGVVAGMTLILKTYDLDSDGRLSQGEVKLMVDRSLAQAMKTGRNTKQLNEMRSWTIDYYAAQDLDHDGYLSLVELLKEPLAEFDCMDQDHDGALTQTEIEAGMDHCGSGREYRSKL